VETLLAPVPEIIRGPAVRSPWHRAARAAVAVWATMTVIHLAVTALSWLTDRGAPQPDWTTLLLRWNFWDAQHYVTIAERGYHVGPGYPAFFPLYPLLVKLAGGGVAGALLVANLAALGALAVLHRLAEHEFGPMVAQRTIWYLAAFPTGFFLFIGYNEGLFILLAAGTLYAARRGHWWLAGALAGLSSATRLFGLLLVVPLAIEYVRRCRLRLRPEVLSLGLVPLGAVAYSVYCLIDLGSPVQFSIAQDQWSRRYTFPGEAWLISVRQVGEHGLLSAGGLGGLLDAGTVLLAVVLLVLCVAGPVKFRRDQLYLVVYSGLTLVLLMSTEVGIRAMQSSARYTMEALAIFLVLARIGVNRTVDRAVLAVGVALQSVLLVLFMAGTFLVA
jgi:hypothetical protein